jgi:hypothetical protein
MTVEIVYPTLDEYAVRVDALAKKYDCDFWMDLKLEQMDEGDRFEFSFIKECLWENLIRHEFEIGIEVGDPPGCRPFSIQDKPGELPGLSFCWEVLFERSRICRPRQRLSK